VLLCAVFGIPTEQAVALSLGTACGASKLVAAREDLNSAFGRLQWSAGPESELRAC